MRKRKRMFLVIGLALIIGIASRYIYFLCHSSPERAIRADLFFTRHYFLEAFRTEITEYPIRYEANIPRYICKNPTIGADFYSVTYKDTKKGKFWYIYWPGTGGG